MSARVIRKVVATTLTLGLWLTIASVGVSHAQPKNTTAEKRGALKEVKKATKTPNRRAAKSKSNDRNRSYKRVVVRTISTNAKGEIDELHVYGGRRTHRVAGCGAKLSDLPHLLQHYRAKSAVSELVVRDGCLAQVITTR